MGNLRGTTKHVYLSKTLAAQNAKRITKLSKQVTLNKGELKMIDFASIAANIPATTDTSVHLTGIPQGDDVNTRDGRFIHIYGIEVRLFTSNPIMDNYLILSKSGSDTAGSPGVVHVQKGGFIRLADKDDYTELHYFRNFGADGDGVSVHNGNYTSYSKRWKRPLKVVYDGGNCIKNALFLHFVNNGTVVHNVTYNVKVYFRDH